MLCYKTQGNYVVSNELPSDTVGWVIARGTMGLGNLEGSLFSLNIFMCNLSLYLKRLKVSTSTMCLGKSFHSLTILIKYEYSKCIAV